MRHGITSPRNPGNSAIGGQRQGAFAQLETLGRRSRLLLIRWFRVRPPGAPPSLTRNFTVRWTAYTGHQLHSWLQFRDDWPQQAVDAGCPPHEDRAPTGRTRPDDQAHSGLSSAYGPYGCRCVDRGWRQCLTLVGTLAAQYLGYRAAGRDAAKIAEEQRKQLDRTLAEQRTRTLTNGSPRPLSSWAAISQLRGLRGCTPWRARLMTGRKTGRSVSTCCARASPAGSG